MTALGIGPGDEVIVPSYTFIATSFSIVQAGAIPRFADVNLDDHCISVESAEKLVTERTKAIMPVHLYGNVCDMDKIRAFAKRHKLFVIEDNAEAFGGAYKGKKTGTLGEIAGCSFCQNKTFTTGGEGGMVTTDDEDLAWTARSFRDHGYDVKQRLSLLELEQKLPYIHNMVGWNYRMTEMQSAIGLAELERMDTWNMPRRQRNAQILINALKTLEADQVLPRRHARAPERLVCAGLLAGRREHEVRHQGVRRRRERRGRAVLEGVLAAMPHGTRVPGAQRLRPNRVSLQVEGIRRPGQRGLQKRGCSECALARGAHVHLFRLPDLHRIRHGANRQCDPEGHAGIFKMKAKIKWGVIGSGGIARRRTIPEGFVPAHNAHLVAVYDASPAINKEVAKKFGAAPVGSLETLLAADIDAVPDSASGRRADGPAGHSAIRSMPALICPVGIRRSRMPGGRSRPWAAGAPWVTSPSPHKERHVFMG